MARRSFIAVLPPAQDNKRSSKELLESIESTLGKGWRGMMFVPPCKKSLLTGLVALSEKRGFLVTEIHPGSRDADFVNRRIVNAADGVFIPSDAKAQAIRGWCEMEGRRVTDY